MQNIAKNHDLDKAYWEIETIYPHSVIVAKVKTAVDAMPKHWLHRNGVPPLPLKWCTENFGVENWIAGYNAKNIDVRFKDESHAMQFKLTWGDY